MPLHPSSLSRKVVVLAGFVGGAGLGIAIVLFAAIVRMLRGARPAAAAAPAVAAHDDGAARLARDVLLKDRAETIAEKELVPGTPPAAVAAGWQLRGTADAEPHDVVRPEALPQAQASAADASDADAGHANGGRKDAEPVEAGETTHPAADAEAFEPATAEPALVMSSPVEPRGDDLAAPAIDAGCDIAAERDPADVTLATAEPPAASEAAPDTEAEADLERRRELLRARIRAVGAARRAPAARMDGEDEPAGEDDADATRGEAAVRPEEARERISLRLAALRRRRLERATP